MILVKPWQQRLMKQRMKAEAAGLPANECKMSVSGLKVLGRINMEL